MVEILSHLFCKCCNLITVLPQTKFAKVMFLHVSVILSRGEGIPACLAGLQAHTQGEVEGSGWGVSRPTPMEKLRDLAGGGSTGPHMGGVSRPWPTQGGVYPNMHRGRPSPSRRLLLRVVRILLECILVWSLYFCSVAVCD